MKTFLGALVLVLTLAATTTVAEAQACSSASKVTGDIWDEVERFVKAYPCVGTVDCLVKKGAIMTDKLIKFWNRMVKNSWARIGPRDLQFNEAHNGTLIGTGGRMFVSPVPASKTPVTITIQEKGGKGKTSVVVCKVNENNVQTKIATKWFNNTNSRQNKSDERRTITVTAAKGDIITVHLDGKSVTKSFSYEVRASQ